MIRANADTTTNDHATSSDRFEIQKAKTKELIQAAFIALLNEKAYDEITVREIAERAQIGFKTYYRHYKDKTELTNTLMSNFVAALSEQLEAPDSFEANVRNIRMVLKFVQDNAATVRAISHTPSRDDLVQPVTQFAFSEGMRLQIEALEGESERMRKRRELVVHHFVHSQLSFFYWWAGDGMTLSMDEMVELLTELIIRPIWSLSPAKNE